MEMTRDSQVTVEEKLEMKRDASCLIRCTGTVVDTVTCCAHVHQYDDHRNDDLIRCLFCESGYDDEGDSGLRKLGNCCYNIIGFCCCSICLGALARSCEPCGAGKSPLYKCCHNPRHAAGSYYDKDPNAPKKPQSSYFLWANDDSTNAKVKAANPNAKVTELASAKGVLWKAMADEEKKPFEEAAAKAKAEYEEAQAVYLASDGYVEWKNAPHYDYDDDVATHPASA